MEVDPPMMFQHWGGFRTIEGFSFEMAAEVDFWEHYCPKCWPVDPGIPRNPFLLQTTICNCNRRWWTLREASPSPETTTTSKKRDKDGTEGLSLIQKLHFNQMSSILRYYGVMHFIGSSPFQHWKGKQLPDNQRCWSKKFVCLCKLLVGCKPFSFLVLKIGRAS